VDVFVEGTQQKRQKMGSKYGQIAEVKGLENGKG